MREVGVCFYSFACGYQLSQHHLLTRVFSPLNCLDIFVEKQLTVNAKVYFWLLTSIPLSYMCNFVLIPHSLNYCNFIERFEVQKFQLCSYSRLFWLFWVPSTSICIWKLAGWFPQKDSLDFDSNYIKFVDQFGKYFHLSNIKTSNLWMWNVFYLNLL